jgi:hypothetical protein
MTLPAPRLLVRHKDHFEIFGFWDNGLIRQITATEWQVMGQPSPTVITNNDEYAAMMAYDRALRQ